MTAPRPSADTRVSGFTLVEILVALTILAIMGGMTTTFLSQLRKASEIQAVQTVQEDLDEAARYMERSLESALALPVDMTQARNRSFLTGSPSSVSFVSAARMGVSPASLRSKTIRLETQASASQIVIRIEPRRFGSRANAPLKVSLLEAVDTLTFEYLDAGSGNVEWLDQWRRDRQLPVAIRFTITRETNGSNYESSGLARLAMARQPS